MLSDGWTRSRWSASVQIRVLLYGDVKMEERETLPNGRCSRSLRRHMSSLLIIWVCSGWERSHTLRRCAWEERWSCGWRSRRSISYMERYSLERTYKKRWRWRQWARSTCSWLWEGMTATFTATHACAQGSRQGILPLRMHSRTNSAWRAIRTRSKTSASQVRSSPSATMCNTWLLALRTTISGSGRCSLFQTSRRSSTLTKTKLRRPWSSINPRLRMFWILPMIKSSSTT